MEPQTLDQDALNLTKAIRQHESGGDFTRKGGSGEYGAYQYMPSTWKSYAKDVLGSSDAPMTPENQNKVAYTKIKQWKDSGRNVGQIASMWNAGEGEPDAYKGTFKNGKPSSSKATGGKPNSQGVQYDTPAYAKKVAEYYQQYKMSGGDSSSQIPQETTQPQGTTLTGEDNPVGKLPVIKQLTQFGAGVGSATLGAGLNLGKALFKGAQGIADLGTKVLGTPKQDYSPITQGLDTINQKVAQEPVQTELNSLPGQAGQFVGTVAPYMETGGPISKLSNTATGAIKGTGLLPAAGRVLAGAGTEGLANVGTGYALSGGDTKQALTQGATAGLLKGFTGAIGEIGNASKLPQRLLGNVYKTDKNAVANIFNEAGTSAEGKTQPLSQWALDKNLKGSLEAQALKVRSILKQSEDKVIASAEASKTKIPVAPNLFKMAQGIQTDFQDVGRGEIAAKADKFLRAVKDNSVSVKDAIEFRRLIDNTLRTKSSFNNPALADNLSYWAEDLRKAINKVDGIGGVNKDYSLAIKAREALIKAATAQANHKALGALESYALGGGLIAGEPLTGVGTVMAKRILQSPRATSSIAQTVKNLPKSSATGSALRSAIGSQLGAINQQ